LQYEESIPYSESLQYLTIKYSIAYSNDFHEITRYDLKTYNYLNPVKLPTSDCEAIKIFGDKMYFTDYAKKIIGYVNLSNL